MSLSSNLAKMAANIISREGRDATLVQAQKGSEGTYNPDTGEFTSTAPSSTTVKVVLMDFALLSNGLQAKAGTLIEANDKQCYMSVQSTSGVALPKEVSPTGDYLMIGGDKWRIVLVKEYNPSGVLPIMYDLMVRK